MILHVGMTLDVYGMIIHYMTCLCPFLEKYVKNICIL